MTVKDHMSEWLLPPCLVFFREGAFGEPIRAGASSASQCPCDTATFTAKATITVLKK